MPLSHPLRTLTHLSEPNVSPIIMLGANLVLLKPINRITLAAAIKSVIGNKDSKLNSSNSNDHDGNNNNTGTATNEARPHGLHQGQDQGNSEHDDILHHHKSQTNSDICSTGAPILSQALAVVKEEIHHVVAPQEQSSNNTNENKSTPDTHRIVSQDTEMRGLLSEQDDQPVEIQSLRPAETTRVPHNHHTYSERSNPQALPTLDEDARSHGSTGGSDSNLTYSNAHIHTYIHTYSGA